MGKLWKYNAKALPEGTVRTWGTRQYKKEGGKWVGIKRGKGKDDKTPNIDSRDSDTINKELMSKADKIRSDTYKLDDSQLEKQMKSTEKYKDAYSKLMGIKNFVKRKDLQDYYYKYIQYSTAKKELERRDYTKRVERWKNLPKPKDSEFQKSKNEYEDFMKKYKDAGKREKNKMQEEHDEKEKKVITDFLNTFKSSEEYARSMLGDKLHDFMGRESTFGDRPEEDLKQANFMFHRIIDRAKDYGLVKETRTDVK